MKKVLAFILVLSLAIVTVFAGGSKESEEDGITLTLWGSSQTMVDFYEEEVIPAFIEKYPEVKDIEVLYMPIEDFVQRLAVVLPAGGNVLSSAGFHSFPDRHPLHLGYFKQYRAYKTCHGVDLAVGQGFKVVVFYEQADTVFIQCPYDVQCFKGVSSETTDFENAYLIYMVRFDIVQKFDYLPSLCIPSCSGYLVGEDTVDLPLHRIAPFRQFPYLPCIVLSLCGHPAQ